MTAYDHLRTPRAPRRGTSRSIASGSQPSCMSKVPTHTPASARRKSGAWPAFRPTMRDTAPAEERGPLHGKLRFRTIWISDTHLGTPGCQAAALLEFLRRTDSQYLYLVGDIVDGWQLKRRWYWHQPHNDVIQKVLRKARKGTAVVYIPGNHDEAARHYPRARVRRHRHPRRGDPHDRRRPAAARHPRRPLRRRGPVRAVARPPRRRALRVHAAG